MNGTGQHPSVRASSVLAAIAIAEGGASTRIVTNVPSLEAPADNAFGAAVELEVVAETPSLVGQAAEAAATGERTAIVADARALAGAREQLRGVAGRRLGVVAHVLCDSARVGCADALALDHLGWGILFASGADDVADLTLVAHRAAEDSGIPIMVVHERSSVAMPLPAISRETITEYLVEPRLQPERVIPGARTSVAPRTVAERLPFALASAMRAIEEATGRRCDAFERAPAADASVVLVGLGSIGRELLAHVDRLRAVGDDVAVIELTQLRPFPGARLVKSLARALAVTVLEDVDAPHAQSAPLAMEIKAAFADALTWAPDYPGIGRIPRIHSGVVRGAGEERRVGGHDLDAVIHNVLANERGKRNFTLGVGDLEPPPTRAG
jgi:pyruvate ferredoxin oxidoreductase alpha subunit